MAIRRALVAGLAILVLAACSGGGTGDTAAGGGGAGGGDGADSAAVAVAAATDAVRSSAPDAVLIALGSGGVVFSPPPEAWNLVFASPSTTHLWRVAVEENGTAGAPEDMGAAGGLDVAALSSATTYDKVGVTPQQAYDAAVAALATSTEGLGTQMGVSFVPSTTVTGSTGEWSVVFTKGTSTEGARRFVVHSDGTAEEIRD